MKTYTTHDTRERLNAYLNRLRSPLKRAYAEQYAEWFASNSDQPEPTRGALSYMAAQGVRLDVDEIIRRIPVLGEHRGDSGGVHQRPSIWYP